MDGRPVGVKRARLRFLAGAALAAFAVLAAGCGPRDVSQNGVRIGAILPLSGENASFGITARAAYRLAGQDAARQQLRKLDLVYGDSKLQKDLALSEFRRLVDSEKVVAFVEVTGSGLALAIAPLAEKDRVPVVSGIDSSPELTTQGGSYFFRVIPSDAYSGKVLATWTTSKKENKAALVFNQQNGWATGFESAILSAYREQGGNLPDSAIIAVTDDTVNFAGAISRLRQGHPQAWFVGLMGRQAGLFVRQATDSGIQGPFYGVDNLAQSEYVQTAGPKGLLATRLALPAEVQSPAGLEFARRYKAAEGRDADAIAFKAYDAYLVLEHAIANLQSSGRTVDGFHIQQALVNIQLSGLTGPIAFDSHHDLKEANYDRFGYTSTGEKRTDADR